MTPDAALVPDPQARAAARLRGATQALQVLGDRSPAEQQRACLFAMNLLRTEVAAVDWTLAGLPEPPPVDSVDPADEAGANATEAGPGQSAPALLPVGHPAVVLLARAAMTLHAAGLPTSERSHCWERLARFFEVTADPSAAAPDT